MTTRSKRVALIALLALADCSGQISKLTEQLKSTDVEQRRAPARALAELGNDATASIAALCTALKSDADADVRRLCAFALSKIAGDSKQALSSLKTALSDVDSKVRTASAYAIVELAGSDPVVVSPLIEAVKAGDIKAIVVLGTLGSVAEDAVPTLTEALLDRRHNLVRLKAAQALKAIGPSAKSALPTLREMATDRDVDVRTAAAEAIGAIDR